MLWFVSEMLQIKKNIKLELQKHTFDKGMSLEMFHKYEI